MSSKSWRVVRVRCLEEEDAVWSIPGSPGVEVALYVITVPALRLGDFRSPGVRSLLAHWTCGVCGSREVVPAASRRGRLILERGAEILLP